MSLISCPACGRQVSQEAKACPQCGHPNRACHNPDSPTRRGPALPAIVRAGILTGAWLPYFALVTFVLPQFMPVFQKLKEQGELPATTTFMISVSHFMQAAFGLPLLTFFTLLILSDLGVACVASRRKGGRALYWAWFAAVILLALAACLLFVVALLLPVFKMSSTVE